jgi:hypothetical protein
MPVNVNAVSRFDAAKQKRGPIRARRHALLSGYLIAGILVMALLFQLFFRYQYVTANGLTWRIDRLTQQTCRLSIGEMPCAPSTPSATVSNSVSTSTSTSTSVSLKVVADKKGERR